MKSIVIAALLAFPSYGIVERVREVQLTDEPPAFAGVFEHSFKPRTGDELLVRLDDGRAVTVLPSEMHVFEPGQRVRVVPDRQGARVERAESDVPL